jgi:hypothetical protein
MTESYSVQQIKFEFLSYIKEFGGKGSDWTIGLLNEEEHQQRALSDNTKNADLIWICKPALSPNAARIVSEYFISRFGARQAPDSVAGPDKTWVHMSIERAAAQL